MPPTMHDIEVAIEAPAMPIPKGNTISQSRKMFSTAEVICIAIAILGDPSRRMSIMPTHCM